MTTEIIAPIAKFIAEKILKQPSKVISADEALILLHNLKINADLAEMCLQNLAGLL